MKNLKIIAMKNIAEILKDCPKGMELDCTMYDNVEFDYVDQNTESIYSIHCLIKTNDGYNPTVFTNTGCNNRHPNAKCVIFPKGKTTWDEFQKPFMDGNAVATFAGNQIFILKSNLNDNRGYCYVGYDSKYNKFFEAGIWHFDRLATEEEKQQLFDAIKAKGYKWNAETKTLEKLIKPKFKVGDIIQHTAYDMKYRIEEIKDDRYICIRCVLNIKFTLPIIYADTDFELVPNKFDITTLKPFDKVLVRDSNTLSWTNSFYSNYNVKDDYPFYCIDFGKFKQCIPFEGNEHLLGTTNDCDDYYKTWM